MSKLITNAFHGVPLSRILAYGAGGVGLAALENKYIGNNLPDPLKGVNWGIGATTGAMLASKDPAMQTAALGAIPLKEMGLFGVGSLDRFRRQQQSLVDTNLSTAKINESAASLNKNDAGGRKALALAFLVPALAAGGAVSANAYMNWKKQHKPKSRFQTDSSTGTPRSSQRIRIDIPPSALPKSFYQSLGSSTRDPRDFTRLQTKRPGRARLTSDDEQMVRTAKVNIKPDDSARLKDFYKWAYTQQPTIPGMIGNVLWGSTGIPMAQNAWREAGYGMNTWQQGDYHDAKRYGLSSAANVGLAALAVRYGWAPVLMKMLGRGRVTGVIRNAMAAKGTGLGQFLKSRQLTEFPTVAKEINRYGGGHQLAPMHLSPDAPMQGFTSTPAGTVPDGYITGDDRMARRSALGLNTRTPLRRALDLKGRYDPDRYAWKDPKVRLPFLSYTGEAKSLPGHLIDTARYGVNRGVNALYAGKQYVKRHPLLTGSLALPGIGAGGVVADDLEQRQEQDQNNGYFDSSRNAPSGQYMPVSSMFGNLVGAFGGGGPMAPLRHQLGG